MKEKYRPSPPAEYAEDPGRLPEEDRTWLREVDGLIWRETSPDRFGHRHLVENDRTCLSEEELERVFRLIRQHGLVTAMGSGTFGFGLSMSVYVEPDSVAPGVKEKPEHLLCLTGHHLPPPDGLDEWPAGSAGRQNDLAWRLFSQFTHSPRNARLLKWYGMRKSEGRGHYEY